MQALAQAHAALSHFPIVLLLLSFGGTLVGRFRTTPFDTFWPLVVGVGVGLFSVVTGLVVHEPYEHLPVIDEIKVHQFLALIGTGVVVAATVARYLARRKGGDVETSSWYPVVAALGIAWIIAVGATGGDLVYAHGINVQGINPLLDSKAKHE